MSNQNFAFAEGYVTLSDEELATAQGGESLTYYVYHVGYGIGEFAHGVWDGFQSWF